MRHSFLCARLGLTLRRGPVSDRLSSTRFFYTTWSSTLGGTFVIVGSSLWSSITHRLLSCGVVATVLLRFAPRRLGRSLHLECRGFITTLLAPHADGALALKTSWLICSHHWVPLSGDFRVAPLNSGSHSAHYRDGSLAFHRLGHTKRVWWHTLCVSSCALYVSAFRSGAGFGHSVSLRMWLHHLFLFVGFGFVGVVLLLWAGPFFFARLVHSPNPGITPLVMSRVAFFRAFHTFLLPFRGHTPSFSVSHQPVSLFTHPSFWVVCCCTSWRCTHVGTIFPVYDCWIAVFFLCSLTSASFVGGLLLYIYFRSVNRVPHLPYLILTYILAPLSLPTPST